MTFFPPATAAISIVSLILQTVQYKAYRIKKRRASDTRWDTTPPALIRDSGELSRVRILRSTHEHMETLTYATWVRHFLNKSTNENAIIDYTVQVNDAAQSFQTATLIDIHYVVSGKMILYLLHEKAALICSLSIWKKEVPYFCRLNLPIHWFKNPREQAYHWNSWIDLTSLSFAVQRKWKTNCSHQKIRKDLHKLPRLVPCLF
ncbi:hypothetical protein E4T56_gene10263 [Termitomyces sp. T112]|nr:hypothetical protein E4T56_gene10263 [Termitomyces sp. T112]